MKYLLIVLLMAASGAAQADEKIIVCYNYGCLVRMPVRYSEAQMESLKKMLQAASSPVLERKILSSAIGQMYRWAGQQTPIRADRGGNYADDNRHGAMDCIDHSTTTTRFLRVLEKRRWLRYHRVIEPVKRSQLLFFEHYSAAIEESPLRVASPKARAAAMAIEQPQPQRFVVDSWFVNNGQPAVILPLEDWMHGEGPDVGS